MLDELFYVLFGVHVLFICLERRVGYVNWLVLATVSWILKYSFGHKKFGDPWSRLCIWNVLFSDSKYNGIVLLELHFFIYDLTGMLTQWHRWI